MALFQNAVAPPFTPIRQGWNRTEQERRAASPGRTYAEDAEAIAIRDPAGKKTLYYMFQTDMKSPETVQATFDVQRQIGRQASVSAGYVHTSGKNLPILLNFANAYDRETGARPNPAVTPGGWYLTSGQTMQYNAFEGSFRVNRFHGLDLALHYTLSKGWSQQGANLVGNFNSSIGDTTYNKHRTSSIPTSTSLPLIGEVRHRVTGTAVYDLPGWLTARTWWAACSAAGSCPACSISDRANRCGSPRRRALRTAGPITTAGTRYSTTGAIRCSTSTAARTRWCRHPRDYGDDSAGQPEPLSARGPGRRRVDLTIAKTFTLRQVQLQVRFESFNVFNWRQYNNPNTNVTAATFGQITSVSATRTGQVGFRLTF